MSCDRVTTGQPFMFVLPFVAICEEKAAMLDSILAVKGQRVHRAFGGQGVGQLLDDGVGEFLQMTTHMS